MGKHLPRRRRLFTTFVVALLSVAAPAFAGAGDAGRTRSIAPPGAASVNPGPLCGPEDDPAVGCGLRVVGSDDVLGRGNNFNLAVVDDCAYVTSTSAWDIAQKTPSLDDSDGVAVLDVSDPTDPKVTALLRTPGAMSGSETIDAVDAGDRKVLVIGSYGGKTSGHPLEDEIGPALDVYDVSGDCTRPRHRATVHWPDNAHNVTLDPSGTHVYGTRFAPNPGPTAAKALSEPLPLGGVVAASPAPLTNIMVMDIADLSSPRLVHDLPLTFPDGTTTMCHTVEFDLHGSRLYCAGRVTDAAHDGREPPESVWQWAGPSIWDISEITQGRTEPTVHFVGQSDVRGQGGHHAVPAASQGRRYLVAANELAITCAQAARPRIWDITDEGSPRVVSDLPMPQAPFRCAGAHYNNVDDVERTTLALVGWMEAGIRVFDIRRPEQPREVAYFRPGSSCKSFVHVHEPTQHLWAACDGGFYVLELAPQVQYGLGRPPRPSTPGSLATSAWRSAPASEADRTRSRTADSALAAYCALPLVGTALTLEGR